MKDAEADAQVAIIVERLKALRIEQGMSLNQLSELAGISHVGIMKIEAGERSPQLRTVLKMAAALKVDAARLFD